MEPEDSLPALSESQTEIMGAIWDLGEATLGQVCAALSSRKELARNTVQTQLTRLVEKGWLSYRAEGKTFFYRPTVSREAAQSNVVKRLTDLVFGGSAEGLVMSLLGGRKLSKDEAARIRAIIEQAEENNA
jgi:predicted transcriptional regulator